MHCPVQTQERRLRLESNNLVTGLDKGTSPFSRAWNGAARKNRFATSKKRHCSRYTDTSRKTAGLYGFGNYLHRAAKDHSYCRYFTIEGTIYYVNDVIITLPPRNLETDPLNNT